MNTSTNQIVSELYEPALSNASSYDRGVGYFTSNWLKMAAQGLGVFAKNNGKVRFIVSPYMSAEDWAALAQGEEAKSDPNLLRALASTINDLPKSLEEQTLSVMAWMVADGLLDFRIAIPADQLDGDFHDKFGVFQDREGNQIGFHGSQNDSAKAYRNYESISIFYSWVDDRERKRVEFLKSRFDKLWNNSDPNIRIFPIPDAIRKKLAKFTGKSSRPYPNPKPLNKWRHQKEALEVFLEKQGGILEMATGTGKTRTALSIQKELFSRGLIDTAVITMSGDDLLSQWYKQLLEGFEFSIFRHYGGKKEGDDFFAAKGKKILLVSRHQIHNLIPYLSDTGMPKSLIICDEVHRFGSPSMIRELTGYISRFGFRLGLSATPEREYDEFGNDFIESEIGPVIFTFTLEQAIERGILCEFDYLPLTYTLSEDDRADIKKAFAKHYAKKAAGEPASEEVLYRDIAKVRKTSLTKIEPFKELVKSNLNVLDRSLLFVETADFGLSVQAVLMEAKIPYHTYFQNDHKDNLQRFAQGGLDCLLSCHKLSEGIDIQSVGTIVLFASSRAKLETVQRLGRCLRIDPLNPQKRALVVDFIEANPEDGSADADRRDWFLALASKCISSIA